MHNTIHIFVLLTYLLINFHTHTRTHTQQKKLIDYDNIKVRLSDLHYHDQDETFTGSDIAYLPGM